MERKCSVMLTVFLVLVNLGTQRGIPGFVFGCLQAELEALSELKHSFKDPSNHLSSWKGNDCCQWEGVSCNNLTGHVEILDLRNYEQMDFNKSTMLSAQKLDLSLLKLRNLRYLDCSGNDFQGSSIPEYIGSMKQLRYLNLSMASLSGTIPSQLGNLARLKALDLSNNDLAVSGDLQWVSGLGSLQILDMSYINLTEVRDLMQSLNKLPSLHNLRLSGCQIGHKHLSHASSSNITKLTSSLQHLELAGNNFQGPIPLCLANMSKLRYLDLSYNSLNGSIPIWLGNMRELESINLAENSFRNVEEGSLMGIMRNLCRLKVLELNDNHLQGDILGPSQNFSKCITYDLETLDLEGNFITATLPYWLVEFRNLKYLSFAKNGLLGPLPTSIRNFSSLEVLSLCGNNMTGTLPYWIGDLVHLKQLSLYENKFSGPIPASIGNLSSLELLYLNSNSFYGSIPSSLGKLSSLTALLLSGNFLEGVVSDVHLANLSSLSSLDFAHNSLEWNLTSSWVPLFQLEELYLGSCKIRGQFPQWIQAQKSLTWLDVSNASITGKLPEWLWSINLVSLDLSHNYLSGLIPHFTPQQNTVNPSQNLFPGSTCTNNDLVQNTSCKFTDIGFLDLSHNELSGTIPDCFVCMGRFSEVINLSFNKLSGRIPETIGLHSSLMYLKMNNNLLEGEIPLTLSNCTKLIILDIGENKLSGEIPRLGGNIPLRILRLRYNQFTDAIPEEYCSLSYLQILDLAHNNLTGSISHCFGNLGAMQKSSMLDYSSFSFPGEYGDSEAYAVEVLKGEELDFTTNLNLIVNIDLSCNGLVGTIPEELTNLSAVQGLNLSYNHLTGNIPQKIGEMRSLESLDLSNNNLSGTIPSTMSALVSLSHLNLSYNKLHGEIPTGNQLQTLDDPSIYKANVGLCGNPLPNKCTIDHGQQHEHQQEEDQQDEDSREKVAFYIVVLLGAATGFWGVVGTLIVKKRWRHALSRCVDGIIDYLYEQYHKAQ